MAASLKSDGKSIGVIIRNQIGPKGKQLFVLFSFSTLILVIGVFADIIAKTFIANPGVGSASTLFILLAVAFGFANRAFGNKAGSGSGSVAPLESPLCFSLDAGYSFNCS